MSDTLTDSRRKALVVHCRSTAEKYLAKGNVARAFSHFLVCSKLSPSAEILDMLVFTLRELGMSLEKMDKFDELFNCYQQALEIFPNSPEMNNNLGAHLFRMGNVEEAATYFLQAVTVNPSFVAAKENLDNVSNTLMERWHFPMLNDQQRNRAYYLAIKTAIENGHKTILDIGTGTGILSMFAVQNGSEKVYACDLSKLMFTLSQNILKKNNMSNKVKILNKHSSDLNIPEHLPCRMSLVVTEILDSGLLGELILPTLSYAWKHLLLPPYEDGLDKNSREFGKVIPAGATVWATLIESGEIRKQYRILKYNIAGINLKCLSSQRACDFYPYTSERLDSMNNDVNFLTTPLPILKLNFNDPKKIEEYMNDTCFTFETKIDQSGTLDAVITWFTLILDEERTISTATKSCWEQAIYPVHSDVSVISGNTVKFQVKIHRDSFFFQYVNSEEKPSILPETNSSLNHYEISKLNDEHYWTVLSNALMQIPVTNCKILDLSSLPIGALICLKEKAQKVAITENNSLDNLVEEIVQENNLDSPAIEIVNYENALTQKWDLVILDVIESSGVFKQDILEDIALLRYSSKNGRFLPDQVTVQCLVVESEGILEMNRLVNDDRVLGFKIADSINNFKVTTHYDFRLDQVTHKLLSNPIELFQFNLYENLDESHLSKTTSVNILTSGTAHAFVYWFKLRYGNEFLETLHHKCTWTQACVVLDEPTFVKSNDILSITAKCSHGCITIDFNTA